VEPEKTEEDKTEVVKEEPGKVEVDKTEDTKEVTVEEKEEDTKEAADSKKEEIQNDTAGTNEITLSSKGKELEEQEKIGKTLHGGVGK
ncbi:MAG TPA: hypothetical protein DDX68_03290, partial [Clostridium sp.]|nr:hypothetical protein [Clostridium sp.]